MQVAPPRALPGPSPALGSGSGNSCAGRTEQTPIPAGTLGHGTCSDLDPWEGGILAERWVGPGQSWAGGSLGPGEEKEKGPAEAVSWLVCQQVLGSVCYESATVLGRRIDEMTQKGSPIAPRGSQGGDGEAVGVMKTEAAVPERPVPSLSS